MVSSLKPGKSRRIIDVDAEDMEWYENQYGRGSCSWLFTMLLKSFRKAHQFQVSDLMSIGAEEVKRLIEKGEAPEAQDGEV